jgi:hypothetical protein
VLDSNGAALLLVVKGAWLISLSVSSGVGLTSHTDSIKLTYCPLFLEFMSGIDYFGLHLFQVEIRMC